MCQLRLRTALCTVHRPSSPPQRRHNPQAILSLAKFQPFRAYGTCWLGPEAHKHDGRYGGWADARSVLCIARLERGPWVARIYTVQFSIIFPFPIVPLLPSFSFLLFSDRRSGGDYMLSPVMLYRLTNSTCQSRTTASAQINFQERRLQSQRGKRHYTRALQGNTGHCLLKFFILHLVFRKRRVVAVNKHDEDLIEC